MVSTTSVIEGEPTPLHFSQWLGKKETAILRGCFLHEPSRPLQACVGEGKELSMCQLQHTHTRTALHHPAFSCSLSKELRASCGPTYLHKQQIGLQFSHICHPLLSSCCLTWALGLSLASLAFGGFCYHLSCMSCSAWCQCRAGVFLVSHKSPNQELFKTCDCFPGWWGL